jgi:hypothetical protein
MRMSAPIAAEKEWHIRHDPLNHRPVNQLGGTCTVKDSAQHYELHHFETTVITSALSEGSVVLIFDSGLERDAL